MNKPSSNSSTEYVWLTAVALLTTLATFGLLLIGGLVNPTGSSLACPDWPLCYGSVMPEMTGGIFYEHTHRLAASAVGLMTWLLAGWCLWRRREDSVATGLTVLAAAMVLLQGVLGGITVLYELPTAISTAHLGLSMIFFLLMITITAWFWRQWNSQGGDANQTKPLSSRLVCGLSLVTLGAVYLQIVLGALVRHTGAGMSCGTKIPFCLGEAWPAWGPGQIHMAHRYGGIIVLALVIVTTLVAVADSKRKGRWLALASALAAPWIVLFQVILGVATVMSSIGLTIVTLHLAGGAILLAAIFLLCIATCGPHLLSRYSIGQPSPQTNSKSPATPDSSMRSVRAHLQDSLALTKPNITLMSMIMAAGGYLLAGESALAMPFAAVLMGTGFAAAAASVLNMYLERDVDRKMKRTQNRPLAQRRLGSRTALALGLLLSITGVATLWYLANLLTAVIGLAAILSYVCIYTPLKQLSPTALLVGAIPGAAPPLMGWTAATGGLELPGLMLFLIMVLWQMPHFLAISVYCRRDYERAGIKVSSVIHGVDSVRNQSIVYTVILVAASLALVPMKIGGALYLVAALALGVWFLKLVAQSLKQQSANAWARRVFRASLIYLPALSISLVVDVLIG